MLKKRYIKLISIFILATSPLFTLIACDPKREEMKLSKDQEDEILIKLENLLKNSNIINKSLFNAEKLREIAKQLLKELIARNEFAQYKSKTKGKTYNEITNDDYKLYQTEFNNLWKELAENQLYQEYLETINSGGSLEPKVFNKGYKVHQTNEWHLINTVKSDGELWSDNVIMEPNEPKFKKKLFERFEHYIDNFIKPSLLDTMLSLSYLKTTKSFPIIKTNEEHKFKVDSGSLLAKSIQGWPNSNLWNSKIKMVWEIKVPKNNKDKLDTSSISDISLPTLPPEEGASEIDNSLRSFFNQSENEIKEVDPIFQMQGFRGFVAYNEENSEETYGKNNIDSSYKTAVFNAKKVQFAEETLPVGDEKINEFWTSNRNYVSKVYVLPIYLADLVKNDFEIDGLKLDVDKSWEWDWLNNSDSSSDSGEKNGDRNNVTLQKANNKKIKAEIFKWLEFTIAKKNGLFEDAEKDLYPKYIQSRDNIYDEKLFNDFAKWFKDLENK